jgi:hypothetical protein
MDKEKITMRLLAAIKASTERVLKEHQAQADCNTNISVGPDGDISLKVHLEDIREKE